MANFLVGVIAQIGEIQNLVSKAGTPFKRRELILSVRRFDPNTGEPFTDNENTPLLVFTGDRCEDLNNFQPGQVVTVYFDIQGRKYTDASNITKIINDIRPYKIELYQSRTATAQAPRPSAPQPIAPQGGQQYHQQGGGYPQPSHTQQGGYAQPYYPPQGNDATF